MRTGSSSSGATSTPTMAPSILGGLGVASQELCSTDPNSWPTLSLKVGILGIIQLKCVSNAAFTNQVVIAVTYVVDQSGAGQYKTIQDAINAVPDNNDKWYQIIVKPGLYREKVIIPNTKPNIYMVGDEKQFPSIEFDDHQNNTQSLASAFNVDTFGSATFTVNADNFVAKNIKFKNTYNLGEKPGHITQAVAVLVGGDKAAFYNCAFEGVQDTLCDFQGQHYFRDCYIKGGMDFIFGQAQSVYENCNLNAIGGSWGNHGYVTAQGRGAATDENGFVFKWCNITADKDNTIYLGRAWRSFSRVVFYKSNFQASIAPHGWDAWNKPVDNIVYAEEECYGPGSNKAGRVAWERKLSVKELYYYINDFNHGKSWLPQQPS
ncbi:putative pectinesterase 29 [Acorus calamus]|uniref:pectinesterase n=1 Tax=Acorus calamus TaxID=4465 RepID=A0AAV9EWJ7_ACOCL|nr:putative pectinesterase 29 [Acorus calamus]